MTITHYDLFAGIGGFSLALEEVFDDATIKHIFCEWESFPTSVLRRHWPDGEFYGDIADLVTHTESERVEGERRKEPAYRQPDGRAGFTIVTGGFPCQPFSHAGRRKGTADDRYQWPNMYQVIRNTKPEWVIAENVRGLVTWNDGLVLETVCTDLESQGYEVQPFIIPAVAVGAPHRRDRVWIIGRNPQYAQHSRLNGAKDGEGSHKGNDSNTAWQDELIESQRPDSLRQGDANVSTDAHSQRIGHGLSQVQSPDGEVPQRHDHAEPSNTGGQPNTVTGKHDLWTAGKLTESDADSRPQRRSEGTSQDIRPPRQEPERADRQYPDWGRNWQEVAFATCNDTVDDGLSRLVDGVPMSRSKWRQNSLKAYGNGIVPEVAMNIMQAIRTSLTA